MKFVWIPIALALAMQLAAADIVFSEIMYDLPGGDEGREWVEIANSGAGSVNLSGWKLFEAGANHGLSVKQGGWVLDAGEHAVIADDWQAFLIEHPSFAATLFDSSWGSLSNTGETLVLKNKTGGVEANLTYSSSWGAEGNNRTLEKKSLDGGDNAGNWGESVQEGGTPGEENSITESTTTTIEPTTTTTLATTTSSTTTSTTSTTTLPATTTSIATTSSTSTTSIPTTSTIEDTSTSTTTIEATSTLPTETTSSTSTTTLIEATTTIQETTTTIQETTTIPDTTTTIAEATTSTTTTSTTTSVTTTSSTTTVAGTTTTTSRISVPTTISTTTTTSSSTTSTAPATTTTTSLSENPAPQTQPADVLISEVMYNPSTSQGKDSEYEYVELHNLGGQAVDLANWTLADDDGEENLVAYGGGGETILEAGGYALVTDEDTRLNVKSSTLHLSTGDKTICSRGLSNTGETLTLRDAAGNMVDQIAYTKSDGGNGNGRSLERTDRGWQESAVGGSPAKTHTGESRRDRHHCEDGTAWSTCSKTRPVYCRHGHMEPKCSECGCPKGLECLQNQSCGKTEEKRSINTQPAEATTTIKPKAATTTPTTTLETRKTGGKTEPEPPAQATSTTVKLIPPKPAADETPPTGRVTAAETRSGRKWGALAVALLVVVVGLIAKRRF